MRIIAGKFKGRILNAVPSDLTRPTTDRVREAIASSVISNSTLGFEEAFILDVFAGSGALGFEALSRGAKFCIFVDKNKMAVDVIKENAASLSISTECFDVFCLNAFDTAVLKNIRTNKVLLNNRFNIIFLDPPYSIKYKDVCDLILQMSEHNFFADDALIVYQCGSDKKKIKNKGKSAEKSETISEIVNILGSNFSFIADKIYGNTQVIYTKYNINNTHLP